VVIPDHEVEARDRPAEIAGRAYDRLSDVSLARLPTAGWHLEEMFVDAGIRRLVALPCGYEDDGLAIQAAQTASRSFVSSVRRPSYPGSCTKRVRPAESTGVAPVFKALNENMNLAIRRATDPSGGPGNPHIFGRCTSRSLRAAASRRFAASSAAPGYTRPREQQGVAIRPPLR